ncbi:hypothetical protein [Flavonifractor sp. An306]|uniref:hypothetical protein n=1 Tax=Flavonifractor sp. An306 TaxID=1965629 RepID=UPI00174AFF57|nr:hypothetical protein [Flavonifractor sp. An306]
MFERKESVPILIPMGATKRGEYCRTVEMLVQMTHCSKADLMFALYLLADSNYGSEDLRAMAKLIEAEGKGAGML